MKRRFCPFLASLCLTVSAAFAASSAARKPNVVLIMADDFGYECVTANGGQSYQTPNLDRMAATGMRFEQCHVQPLCTPTRVQLMTGLSNIRNYVEFGAMDRKAVTFAHLLKKAGYVTGICGKWQLGQQADSPQHFGFDEALLWWHMRRASRYPNPGFELNGVAKNFPGGYGPKVMSDFVLDFVARHQAEPFFLYYPLLLTHGVYQPTPDSKEWDPTMTERDGHDPKHFADMTRYMDKMIGDLLAKLDALGLTENTLVLFLGDNGTGREIVSQFQGRPYPGGKGESHARGTRVPLLARWPGRIAPGQVNRDLIVSTDFLPTLCEVAGASIPDATLPDGRSFLPQLLGQDKPPRETAYFWYAPDGGPTAKYEFAMSTAYKLYRDGTFFALQSDPFEERPLSVAKLEDHARQAAAVLQSELDRYKDARPAHLRQPYETAKKAKKAERQKKKR